MTSRKPLNGYLDRMRKNIHVLDESIESVSKTPRNEKPAEKRARLKLLRDFVELQNAMLVAVKTHLLGRDETGASKEPPDSYDGNDQVEFERYFKRILAPWSEDDLKLKCESCHREREDVSTRHIPHEDGDDEYIDLCDKCYEKRPADNAGSGEEGDSSESTVEETATPA